MSIEKEIPFVIFLKSTYEVRPKKYPEVEKSHHWKLRIDGLKSDKDIRRVEFFLHDTFKQPLQVKKKPPFEIEEDGFGNFDMQINVKMLSRAIRFGYSIELYPSKHCDVQYHQSLWMVKPKEWQKVLEIGGIPIERYENSIEEAKMLSKLSDYVRRHGESCIFCPKVYERVLQKIRKMEHSESIPAVMMNNADMDMGHSDDSGCNRQLQSSKQHRHNKQNLFDPVILKVKSRNQEFEPKKEMKRKKNVYGSSSESEAEVTHESIFGKSGKRSDMMGSGMGKSNEVKVEKSLKRPDIKQEPNLSKLPMKPLVKIENKLQKPPKESKLKLKFTGSNPDSFSKLFEAPDLIVLNKNKTNVVKDKIESHDSLKRKIGPRETDHSVEESKLQKKAQRLEGRPSMKESKHSMKSTKTVDHVILKPPMTDTKKHKPPEKTMPPDQKKEKKSEHKPAKLSSSFYSKPLSSLSSSASELGSISSKSSSDNEVDPQLFRRKKSPLEHSKVVVKQLFGDDVDGSDDDDQADDITDLFSDLKNSGMKKESTVTKRRQEASVKSDEDGSSENDIPSHRPGNGSLSQSPDSKPDEKQCSLKDRTLKVTNVVSSAPKNVQEPMTQTSLTDTHAGQQISLKERRKLAKMLLKIKNKKFFAKFQRLLLISFENREKSVSFDHVTLRLDFHMGEVSDELVGRIRCMVDEYMREHGREHSREHGREQSREHGREHSREHGREQGRA